jgi:hypothetical protein
MNNTSKVQQKQLRKDNTMKVLPTHFQNQNMNMYNHLNNSNRNENRT